MRGPRDPRQGVVHGLLGQDAGFQAAQDRQGRHAVARGGHVAPVA